VSTTDGDASSRLESALADVFAGAPSLPARDQDAAVNSPTVPGPSADDDWNVDGDDDEPIELPEIVPATAYPSPPAPPVPSVAPPASAPVSPVQAPVPATSWGDHMTSVPAGAQGAPLRAPGRRPRVRRVTRVLRHVDPWSTFKVALLFSVVAYLVTLTSGVLLWQVADSTGTLDNVERWFTQFGWETFELKGGEIFQNAWIIGLFGAVALTGGLVLLATLFNLVSDIVGGVRMTVLEEEVVERTVSSTRRYVVRRAPAADGGTDEVEDWDVDDDHPASGDTDAPPATAAPRAPTNDDWSVDLDDDEPTDTPAAAT